MHNTNELYDISLEYLSERYVEISNAYQGLPEGRERAYLKKISMEIAKRLRCWAAIVLTIAIAAGTAGGKAAWHFADGMMPAGELWALRGVFALAVIVISAGIANKKLLSIDAWACTMAANWTARKRRELEEERETL